MKMSMETLHYTEPEQVAVRHALVNLIAAELA